MLVKIWPLNSTQLKYIKLVNWVMHHRPQLKQLTKSLSWVTGLHELHGQEKTQSKMSRSKHVLKTIDGTYGPLNLWANLAHWKRSLFHSLCQRAFSYLGVALLKFFRRTIPFPSSKHNFSNFTFPCLLHLGSM